MSKIRQVPIFNLDWWGLGDSRRGFDWTLKDLTGVALLVLALGGGTAQCLVHYGLFEARLPGLGLLGPLSVVLGVLALWRTADRAGIAGRKPGGLSGVPVGCRSGRGATPHVTKSAAGKPAALSPRRIARGLL